MLLDLGRNDVGRVAAIGTVKVTDQFFIERYSHVMHIVSNVEGTLADNRDALDALAAGFPAGTVSGAPKVRAMQIIDELEKEKRGLYAGCVGYFSAAGEMDTCIVLRTALIKDGTMYVQAGAGIVADSDPATNRPNASTRRRRCSARRKRRGASPAPPGAASRPRLMARLLAPPGSPKRARGTAMIMLVDNYDSFTFNLVHYLGGLGADVAVHRNDKIAVKDVLAAEPEAIVLSPGPCTPNEAGICLDLIEQASPTVPILGVCLGHQAIGQAFGGNVVRATQPVHGKLSEMRHQGAGVFRGINGPFKATRYHSLVVERASMPDLLTVNAETADHLVMGLMHETSAGAWRPISSREHCLRTRSSNAAQLSRTGRGLERSARARRDESA